MSFKKGPSGREKRKKRNHQEELKFIPLLHKCYSDIFINKLIDSHLVRRYREIAHQLVKKRGRENERIFFKKRKRFDFGLYLKRFLNIYRIGIEEFCSSCRSHFEKNTGRSSILS